MKKLLVFALLLSTGGQAHAKEAQARKITIINTTEHTLKGVVGPHSPGGRRKKEAVDVTVKPYERHVVTFDAKLKTIGSDEIKLQIEGKKRLADETISPDDHSFWVSESHLDPSGIRIRDFPPSRSSSPSPTRSHSLSP